MLTGPFGVTPNDPDKPGGAIAFGGGPPVNKGDADAFVAMLDPAGGHRWSTSAGDVDRQVGTSVAVDKSGDTIIVGHFTGTIDLGGGPLSSPGRDVPRAVRPLMSWSFALYAPGRAQYRPRRGDEIFPTVHKRRRLDPLMRVILQPATSPEPAAPVRAPPPPPEEVPTVQQIFAEHASFVWRTLKRLGVRDADVEDLCQDVFLVVHNKLAEFQARSSIRTWLYGICIRTASDYRRSARVRNEEVTASIPEQSIPAEQHQTVERRRALERLDAVLDQLDDDKRAVFVLYEIEQLTMSDVAEAVGCPLQTAYSRLHAARKHVELAFRGGAL